MDRHARETEDEVNDPADRLAIAIKRLVRNAVAKRLEPLELRLRLLESTKQVPRAKRAAERRR